VHEASWIELDGAANARDLAGLPTADGRTVQPGRLIRSDNLQDLTERDVAILVDALRVRSVADLRTGVEVVSEGPGPLTEVDDVDVRHLSLFPESGTTTDAAAVEGDDERPVVLPWQNRDEPDRPGRQGVSGVYLGYLDERADSVIDALRLIAYSPGATIVHCAAGKDRTGTVVALALTEVGVTRNAIVADYVRSGERMHGIFARLRASSTYREDLESKSPDAHAPKPATMERLLAAIDAEFGGVAAWLRTHGWTERDAATLRAKLLEP
jgi:protein tyrosine/serine phosphatase